MYRNGQYVAPPTATITSTLDFTVKNVTPITSLNNDKYTFSGNVTTKYAQAIIDCVKMTGFMQLKDSDFNAAGANPAQTKRILKEATETRKAADVLLASGAIVLMGTWSNGIQVGPGAGFARIDRSAPAAKPAKKVRKPAAVKPVAQPVIVCTYDVPEPCQKPRYRVPLAIMQAACGVTPRTVKPVGFEVKRVESLPFNFVLLADDTVRISSGGRFVEEPSARLMQEARTALGLDTYAAEVQAATIAQLEDALSDNVDEEIDALMNAYAGYDIAAG